MADNPFDALDEDSADAFLTEAPPPTLGERFRLNFEAAQRGNTLLGAAYDASTASRRREREMFDETYAGTPEWQSWGEGAAALAGQIAGTAASPENFLPIGLGEKILVGSKAGVSALWNRVFTGAIDAATVNAATDLAIQGVETQAGFREGVDPAQLAASTALGGLIGGAGGAVARGIEKAGERRAVGQLFKAAAEEKAAANPFDRLDETPPQAPGAEAQPIPPDIPAQPEVSAPPAAPAAPKPVPEPEPVAFTPGETVTVRDPAIADLPAGELDGQQVTVAPDQADAPKGMVIVQTPDGQTRPIGEKLLEPAQAESGRPLAGEASAPPESGKPLAGEVSAPPESGKPLAGEASAPPESGKPLAGTPDAEPVALGEALAAKAAKVRGFVVREPDGGYAATNGLFPNGRQAFAAVESKADATVFATKAEAQKAAKTVTAARKTGGATGKATVEEFFDMAQPATGPQAMRGQLVRDDAGTAKTVATAVESVERVRETAAALAKALDVTATRQGRMSGRAGKKLGQFGLRSGVVRVRHVDDFDTLTHEYGHHLHKAVPEVNGFIAKHKAELERLDYDPKAGRDYEGFAEFFRLWLTNRPYVAKNHPALATDFAALLVGRPEIADGIEAASQAWSKFLSAPSSAAVASTIVSAKKGGWAAGAARALKKDGLGGTISDVLQRMYAFLFDDLNPLNRAMRHLEALHETNTGRKLKLSARNDAYKLARMSRGAYSSGHMDIMYGVAPYRGLNPETPSLRDALIEAMGKPNALSKWDDGIARDFGSYLWSRRALGEWERYRNGEIPNPPDKLTEGDHKVNVAEMEKAYPQFVSAAPKVHAFAHGLWKKKFEAGLIGQETYLEGLRIVDYVPGLRDFSDDADVTVRGKDNKPGKTAKGGWARRFKGSKRDVINPLESLANDAYETSMAIARNDVVKALDRLAITAGMGGGAIAERIPVKEMRATLIDPLEAVEAAAKNAGLSKPDIITLRDAVEGAVGDAKAAIFRPAVINDKGEPIVFFRDGGELRALRLADGRFGKELYGALAAMSKVEKNFWLDLVAMPARILRMGITTSPEFIAANFIRDQTMAWVYFGKPLRRVGASLAGAVDDLLGRDAAIAYNRVGGITGGQETASLARTFAERDLSQLRRKGWAAQRLTSWRGVLQVTETAETATRLGLFRTFTAEAMARGLSGHEAALEAAWRARDYIDFDRRGAGMAALARVVPFLNVALQGLDKTGRHMVTPLARKMLRLPMTAEDEGQMGEAVKSWARVAMLVTGAMSLYALMSRHEDHDEISTYTRSTHFMVKAGEKWVAVPKPFEFAVAINLAEATYDALKQNDPTAAARWLDSMGHTLMPPSLIEGNPAIKSWFEVRTNTSLFTGAPIVPEQMQGMEPWLQYNARTSELARQFGEWFNVSPVVAEHLFVSHLGSWGRGLLSAYDMAQPDAPTAGWDDAPITRRFIKDASKGAQSVTAFWEAVSETTGVMEGKYRSWRALSESDDKAGAADYYASLNDIDKAYVAAQALPAEARRLHPMVRARGALQAIGQVRRELADNRVAGRDGGVFAIDAPARTAADDILSTAAMAVARNALIATGVPGWTQKAEIDETGFWRELQAASPELSERLADAFATKRVWRWEAVKESWPEMRSRALQDGSAAIVKDLVIGVEAQGPAIDGGLKRGREERPQLTPE